MDIEQRQSDDRRADETASSAVSANSKPQRSFSANADWVRALQRTVAITSTSRRTICDVVAEVARKHGARPALIGVAETLTYADLSARADLYAGWARGQGLAKGDRVALMLANQPDYPAIWIGLARIGVVTALINTQLVGDGLAHSLSLAEAKHLVVGAEMVHALQGLDYAGAVWIHGADHRAYPRIDTFFEDSGDFAPETDAPCAVSLQDPALLIYTSGTTGLPKAAHVSHYRVMMWSEWFAGILDAGPDDRLFNCLPMYHSIGGVVAVGAMLAAGGAVVVRDGFSASRFWPDVTATGATIFQYIGELCRYLLGYPAPAVPHKLRLCVGNGLRADIWERFAERFAIPRIIEFYAATEGSFSLFNLEGHPGAIGRVPRFLVHRSPVALVRFDHEAERPIRDAEGRCLRCPPGEVGEAIGMIAHSAAGLATRFEGYTSEVETARKVLCDVFAPGDMWFRTGDLMRQDEAGFFYFVDRIGDTFRWKGENVATCDVADAIGASVGVLDVAVFGVAVPHADGRAGMAALVVGPQFDLAQFRRHLGARLPRFARPVFLRICGAMNATGTFKTKKQDFVRDGFDPARISDALYVDDEASATYVPVNAARFADIDSGRMRL